MDMKRKLAGLCLATMFFGTVGLSSLAADVTVSGTADYYEAYRLVRTDVNGSVYSHSVNPEYRDVLLLGAEECSFSFDRDGDGAVSDEELVTGIKGLSGTSVRTYADALHPYLEEYNPDHTTDGGTFHDLPAGWYLIDGDGSFTVLEQVGTQDIDLSAKEEIPTLDTRIVREDGRTVDAMNGGIGDEFTVEYEITLPERTGDDFGFTVHTDGEGFEPVGSAVFLVGGKTGSLSGIEMPSDDGCLLHESVGRYGRVLSVDGAPVRLAGTMVTMRQVYRLTDACNTKATGNGLRSRLMYTADPYDTGILAESQADKVTVFSYGVTVHKTDLDGNALPGAAFSLYRQDGDAWDEVPGTQADGSTFRFAGISAGTYRLSETGTPDGYEAAEDLTFTIRADYSDMGANQEMMSLAVYQDGKLVSGDGGRFSVDLAEGTVSLTVANGQGGRLPGTGAQTRLMVVIGGIALAGVGTVIVIASRKKAKKGNRD